MKEYEIWVSAHGSMGDPSPVQLLGKEQGDSFLDAVKRFHKKNKRYKKGYFNYTGGRPIFAGRYLWETEQDAINE